MAKKKKKKNQKKSYGMLIYFLIGLVLIVGICIWEWNALAKFQLSYDDEMARKVIFESETVVAETEATTIETTTEAETTAPTEAVTEVAVSYDLIAKDYADRVGIDLKNVVETPIEDEELASRAIYTVELYLKHVNGLAELGSLQSVMLSSGKAYKAVVSSQNSLKWLIKSKTLSFTSEEVTDMVMFDDEHYACDVYISLTKVPDTERERVVDEDVHYRLLMEKVSGTWYAYSFMTK